MPMNRGTRQRIVPIAPFIPMLLLRWMLVLVLVVDFVGSLWHAHHHEGGPDGYVPHSDGNHDLLHGHGDGEVASLALRTTPLQLLQNGPQNLESPYWFSGLLTPPTVEVTVRLQPGKERKPIPLFRTVPPAGRAPPTLHA